MAKPRRLSPLSFQDLYPTQLQDGLLLVIRKANTDFLFKDLDIKRTYNDSLTRVRWRSKQNLDYAALIEFCASLCQYYLHLEDDVTAAQAYIQRIREFIEANNHRTWAMLEVCSRGRSSSTVVVVVVVAAAALVVSVVVVVVVAMAEVLAVAHQQLPQE